MKPNTISQLQHLRAGNPPAADAGFYGASIDYDDAQIVLLPVPFEATTSYGGGAALGPTAIRKASHQMDLLDPSFGEPYLVGIGAYDEGREFLEINHEAQLRARRVIESWEAQTPFHQEDLHFVNEASSSVNELVYHRSKKILSDGKLAAVLGGDHSVPLGFLKALGERYQDFGILHIDAHHDLRVAYEGFTYSHASIMYNALKEVPEITSLLSLGIRDYSQDERDFAAQSPKIQTLYDHDFSRRRLGGERLPSILAPLLAALPQHVYLSFDIDGLDPALCPNTGTPVPGGLSFNEACFILEMLVDSGKTIIGFDLTEVSPGGNSEWDANVGARILYKLCGALAKSQKLQPLSHSN